MKRMFVIAMVLILGIAHSATAQDNTTHAIQLPQVLEVKPAEKVGVYNAIFTGPFSEKVKLSLYDEDGNQLSTKYLKQTAAFKQVYNLRNVAAGTYTWELSTPYQVFTQSVEYAGLPNPVITFLPSEETDKLKLILTDESKEPLTVSIFDEEDRLLHTQTVSSEKYEQYYNLEQIEGSYVTFVVMNPVGKSSSETYVIR